ncbi:MAGUK p55 subfamily member 6 [Bagarius yarrelli]|uniref:MAGUK p55 subfamily member 6 n=1 Tax=Bagarius yarrelli TaxID=175774 RepID=A0A556U8Q7_BAGYA|nr:MAGUK p55 subfamily member 6 [Bagarius yarrelli]
MTMANGFILPEGKMTPNTLFVGGIDMKVEENEIRDFFARFGAVKEVKIITYRGGICKGYGFVYFSEDVDIQTIAEQQVTFKGKKLKLGPAIMKERSSRSVQSPLMGPSQWVGPSPCVYCTCCPPNLVTPSMLSGSSQYLQPYSYPSFPGLMIPQMPMNYNQTPYPYPDAAEIKAHARALRYQNGNTRTAAHKPEDFTISTQIIGKKIAKVKIAAVDRDRIEDMKLEAVQANNVELVKEILGVIHEMIVRDHNAAELSHILQQPHFQSLLEVHDIVASKSYSPPPRKTGTETTVNNALLQPDAVRIIGIHKKAGVPLGVTFRVERDNIVIARILCGGMIDRQGLLHVGDIIKEVNGQEVGNKPTELQEILKNCSGEITIKILPSYTDSAIPPQVYVKPHFDYNPATDNLIPCREAGLAFKRNDILQIVNREDLNWWQACHMMGGATGLIPSQFLEEKRKAFVPKDLNRTDFDSHELQIYEEVACLPPFQRRTLIMIGAQGVGRRSLKKRLLMLHPERYGTTIPFTSRRPRGNELNAQTYHFVTRMEMEMEIKLGCFLEHGEYDGNLYGTKISSVHEVMNTGRTCILDVHPQTLKLLRTAEFMPYVVFIAAPEFETLKTMHKAVVDAGITTKQLTDVDLKKRLDESARIEQTYRHYFDLSIVNDNLDTTFETLQETLDKLFTEPQWVPVSWVY